MAREATPLRRPARTPPPPLPNRCADAEVADRIAVALERLADNVDRITPTLEVMHDFAERFEALCTFLRKWAPRLLWILPALLTLSNTVSPQLGEALTAIIMKMATTPGAGG